MAKSTVYKTRQGDIIKKALKELGSGHFTVDSLCEALSRSGECVGRTTVYRRLEQMAEEGLVRKYIPAAGESACYQYIADAHCSEHFHLKCEGCGRLIHVECGNIDEMCRHIGAEHNFEINRLKTVLYGLCGECSKK